MTLASTAASGVGAGVSFRGLGAYQTTRLKEQEQSYDDVSAAALHLIQNALTRPAATGHDLDVLA